MLEDILTYFTIGESTLHNYIAHLEDAIYDIPQQELLDDFLHNITSTFDDFKAAEREVGTVAVQPPYNLLDNPYDAILAQYAKFTQYFVDIAENLLVSTTEIGHMENIFDKHLSQNVALMQISNTIQETLLQIIAKDLSPDDVDKVYIEEQIAIALRHKESYTENASAMLTTLNTQCTVLELVLDKLTSSVPEDRAALLVDVEAMLMSSPFHLPVELFVSNSVEDVQISTLIDELTDMVSRVYQEYPTVNEITNELMHSDVFRLAIDNQEGFVKTLNTLRSVCNTYFRVYADVEEMRTDQVAYEPIDLTDQTVLNERMQVTTLLTGAPYFLSSNLFQLPEETMLNEAALRQQAAQLSAWLDLVADTEQNGIRYNSEFVKDIIKSIQDTPANISYTNYKVFRMCADVAIKDLEITDNDLINWLIATSETSPALVQAKNEIMSGKAKLTTKQCVIKDWLHHNDMAEPNILAFTETMRGKSKSSSKYTAKYLQETLVSATKAVASLFTIYPMAFKIQESINPVTLDPNTVFSYSKVFPNMFNVVYQNKEEAKVEKRIADLATYLCGQLVGIELSTWDGARNSSEIPDLPITTTRVEQLSAYTERMNTAVNKFLRSKEEFESASADAVRATTAKKQEELKTANWEGSVQSLDERITTLSKERDEKARNLATINSEIETSNKVLKSEHELITTLREFNEKLKILSKQYAQAGNSFEAMTSDKEYVQFITDRLVTRYSPRFKFLLDRNLNYAELLDKLDAAHKDARTQYKQVVAVLEASKEEHENIKQDLQKMQERLDTEMGLKRELHDEVANMSDMTTTVNAANIALDRAAHAHEIASTALVDLTKNKIVPMVLGFGVKFTPEFSALLK